MCPRENAKGKAQQCPAVILTKTASKVVVADEGRFPAQTQGYSSISNVWMTLNNICSSSSGAYTCHFSGGQSSSQDKAYAHQPKAQEP